MQEPRTPLNQGIPCIPRDPPQAQRVGLLSPLAEHPIPEIDSSPCPLPTNRAISGNLEQKMTKINQAKEVLEGILNDQESLGSKALIIDGIQVLDAIMNQIQNPQEIHDQDLKPIERLVYKMHIDLNKVNNKVDQILEKPTYAEIVQSSSPNKLPSQPLSPRVVIPPRKDLGRENYPLISTSHSSSPSPIQGQEGVGAL